jgi:hypothetical protein
VSWGDYDRDGDLDLAVGKDDISFEQSNEVYENTGGELELIWWSPEKDATRSGIPPI